MMFVYYIKMMNGDVHNLFTEEKMDLEKLSKLRWIKYVENDGKTKYLNITQISSITKKEIQPPESDE